MKKIEIYTKYYCPYCSKAKALLDKKGVKYTEYELEKSHPEKKSDLEDHGKRTVPQIVVDGDWIGGCDDIYDLDRQNKLNNILGLA